MPTNYLWYSKILILLFQFFFNSQILFCQLNYFFDYLISFSFFLVKTLRENNTVNVEENHEDKKNRGIKKWKKKANKKRKKRNKIKEKKRNKYI